MQSNYMKSEYDLEDKTFNISCTDSKFEQIDDHVDNVVYNNTIQNRYIADNKNQLNNPVGKEGRREQQKEDNKQALIDRDDISTKLDTYFNWSLEDENEVFNVIADELGIGAHNKWALSEDNVANLNVIRKMSKQNKNLPLPELIKKVDDGDILRIQEKLFKEEAALMAINSELQKKQHIDGRFYFINISQSLTLYLDIDSSVPETTEFQNEVNQSSSKLFPTINRNLMDMYVRVKTEMWAQRISVEIDNYVGPIVNLTVNYKDTFKFTISLKCTGKDITAFEFDLVSIKINEWKLDGYEKNIKRAIQKAMQANDFTKFIEDIAGIIHMEKFYSNGLGKRF